MKMELVDRKIHKVPEELWKRTRSAADWADLTVSEYVIAAIELALEKGMGK